MTQKEMCEVFEKIQKYIESSEFKENATKVIKEYINKNFTDIESLVLGNKNSKNILDKRFILFEYNGGIMLEKLKLGNIDETKLREAGFTDYYEPYWYYCERLYEEVTFNLTIPKNNLDKWYIDVLDELFLQPYPFKSIKTEYARRVERRYNEVIEKLKSLGIFI